MGNVRIRKMTISDIEGVMEIEQQCFSVPWSREAFILEISQNKFARYLVVEEDGKVVGYGGMWIIIEEAHITNIAVHPAYREKGYGSRIVKALIQAAEEEGIFRMTLEVRKSNVVAQRLYRKYGFKACGVRPGYYQDNYEDAVIMWKE